MNKLEVEQHIIETTAKVKAHKEFIASLETQSENVAAQGDVKKVVAAKKELTAARELLDGLELVLKAYQKKATEFQERREPEAAKIRARLADELWPLALVEYEKLQRLQGELGPILGRITSLNDEMRPLRNQHENLIGDSISIAQIPIPRELYVAANLKLEPLPKMFDARLASEREEERLATLFKEQKPTVDRILRLANQAWPTCPEPTCGAPMLAQRRGPNMPAYGISEDGKRAFANFRCQKHSQWTRDIVFPPPPPAPGARYPIPEDSAPVQSVFAVPPRNDGHGLATPGLTGQNNKGGKKAT